MRKSSSKFPLIPIYSIISFLGGGGGGGGAFLRSGLSVILHWLYMYLMVTISCQSKDSEQLAMYFFCRNNNKKNKTSWGAGVIQMSLN